MPDTSLRYADWALQITTLVANNTVFQKIQSELILPIETGKPQAPYNGFCVLGATLQDMLVGVCEEKCHDNQHDLTASPEMDATCGIDMQSCALYNVRLAKDKLCSLTLLRMQP